MAYTAFITVLENVQKDPNSNNLYTATALGEGVIVGGDAYEGQRVIYFPADGCLCDYDFAMAFNLLRKDKDGNAAGGYLDPSMHIKAIKLRGLRSEGIVIALDKFAAYFKLTSADFKDGEAIDRVGKEVICKKYLPRQKVAYTVPATSMKGKKRSGISFPEFEMHCDTAQLLYNKEAFSTGDSISLSLKLHGTSQRTMLTEAEMPNGFFRRLFHMKKKTKPVYVLGTRRTVLLDSVIKNGGGFYGNDSFRVPHHEKIRPYVTAGMEVFYEVVGFVNESTPIMPSCDNKKINDKEFIRAYGPTTAFTYGCEPGESEMYVYRITSNGGEYSPCEIKEWCREAGVKSVPYLESFIFTTWEDLMQRVNRHLDGPDLIDPRHVREGVVCRIINKKKFTAFKIKNMSFKILSGIASEAVSHGDTAVADSLFGGNIMAKYRDTKNYIVEAEVYREGVEDGFIHYSIGSSVETGEFYSKDSPYFPRNCRRPVLREKDGSFYLIKEGDYIVTLADGSRKVEDEKIFSEKYLLLDGTIDKI